MPTKKWGLPSVQFSLRAAIMSGATAIVVILGLVFSVIAYSTLSRVTLEAAQSWSKSVAQLASSSNTSAVILNDIAAMESNLQQVAKLPGIDKVSIFRADGRELVKAIKSGDQVISTVGGSARVPLILQGVNSIEGILHEGFYEAWAPIHTGREFPSAWVQVNFNLTQRGEDLNKLKIGAGGLIAILLAVLLTCLNWLINRTIEPIRELSRFAASIPTHFGSQITVTRNYREVGQLGVALNQASREIADQVGRTRAIVNTASEAIIGLDDAGRIITLNPVAIGFFGHAENALLHENIEKFIPGLHAKALYEMFDDPDSYYFGMDRILRRDLFGLRIDGTFFPLEISLGRVEGIKGLRYVCIVRDVTDERAALEFTELYERALACSHNAVFITNAKLAEQPVIYVNNALQTLLDCPLHEVLGRQVDALLNIDASDPALKEMRSALVEKRHTNVTLRLGELGAHKRTVELSLSPVMNDKGEITQMIGIVSDVTERVRTEVVNEKRRAQLDAIFSLSPDGFVLFDANDSLVFANPAFQRMMGLPSHGGQTAAMKLPEFDRFMANACNLEQLVPELQFDSNQTDGAQEWQARLNLVRPQTRVVQAQARRNIDGRSETIFYFRDITHEDAVDRMKSEFLAAAAHELRTPMVSIFGFTELLLRRKFTPERQADMLDTIHRQSGLLVKMINELLDLARIESRRGLDLHIEASSLVDMLYTAVKGLMLKDNERQVTMGPIPQEMVLIDTEKIQLAMNNLLSNAFKYSPAGGEVTLNAHLETEDGRGFAVVEVSDRGMGMKPEQLERAFERFYRADASGNIPGTGLGLSMVKEVANLHSGRIELESVFGSGTTARLWIPVEAQPQVQTG